MQKEDFMCSRKRSTQASRSYSRALKYSATTVSLIRGTRRSVSLKKKHQGHRAETPLRSVQREWVTQQDVNQAVAGGFSS